MGRRPGWRCSRPGPNMAVSVGHAAIVSSRLRWATLLAIAWAVASRWGHAAMKASSGRWARSRWETRGGDHAARLGRLPGAIGCDEDDRFAGDVRGTLRAEFPAPACTAKRVDCAGGAGAVARRSRSPLHALGLAGHPQGNGQAAPAYAVVTCNCSNTQQHLPTEVWCSIPPRAGWGAFSFQVSEPPLSDPAGSPT
jgi:hypothetical protein